MKGKKKIVVIDDEKDLCFLMKTILEDTGQFSVEYAHNGLDGQKLCKEILPDLIFLDFIMPIMQGDQVAKGLKEDPKTQDIPIVFISGLGEMTRLKKTKELNWFPNKFAQQHDNKEAPTEKWSKFSSKVANEIGVEAYLPKPFSKKTLLEVTNDILKSKDG